jgi:ArsR family transcriptional regulator
MLTVARSNLERAQLRTCLVRHGDMYQLPLQGGSFDAVTIHQVLHFAERPGEVIGEAARVLRPGGRLIVVDFDKHELEFLRDEQAHRWLGFREDEVTDWFGQADLKTGPTKFLPGDPLTVGIWQARQAA